MGRDDSPADVQITRSFVAVAAGLVIATGLLCPTSYASRVERLPPEFRAVAMILDAGAAIMQVRR